jgi:ATP-dependent Clp protease ATP-binding subunit ClpC
MFERFTDRARRVVVIAQEEARNLDHNYIGTEHLLVGLLAEDEGVAAKALLAAGLTTEEARAEIERRIGRGPEPPRGHIPFTPRAKKVLELSLRQALQLGHNYIGTEHILLGIVREGEGVAAQILTTKLEGGVERVLEDVGKLLNISAPLLERIKLPGGPARHAIAEMGSGDELRRRLEAIEARLSVIEQLLRDRGREEEVS